MLLLLLLRLLLLLLLILLFSWFSWTTSQIRGFIFICFIFFLRRRVFDGIEEIFKFEYGTELGLEYIIIYRDSIRQQQQEREREEKSNIWWVSLWWASEYFILL